MKPYIALLLFAAAAAAQNADYRVAGQVLRKSDDQPLKHARVLLLPAQQMAHYVSCLSDEEGRFSFAGIGPGKYALRVSYRGWTQDLKQHDQYSTAIAVGPGLDSQHVRYLVTSPAKLTVRVVDEDDPAPNILVYVFYAFMGNGRPRIALMRTQLTDQSGAAHLTGLPPGTYYVQVSGRPWYAQVPQPSPPDPLPDAPPPPRPKLDLAYPITPGPGPIQLAEGGAEDLSIEVHATPAAHVTFSGFEAQPDRFLMRFFSRVGPGGSLISDNGMMVGDMSELAPGDYVVSASVSDHGKTINLGSEQVSVQGDTAINVNDLVKKSVLGQVVTDRPVNGEIGVQLRNVENGFELGARANPDGSFEMDQVQPGRYEVVLNSSEVWLQSVAVRGGKYVDGVIDIAAGAHLELKVRAAHGITKMNGIAMAGGKPVSGAMVLLLPRDGGRATVIPRDQTDSDGTFTLNFVPPGHYALVAIDDGRDLEYANPAVMQPYLANSQAVDAPLGKNAILRVEVQHRQ